MELLDRADGAAPGVSLDHSYNSQDLVVNALTSLGYVIPFISVTLILARKRRNVCLGKDKREREE